MQDFPGAILAVSHDRAFIDICADQGLGFKAGQVQLYPSFSAYRTDLIQQAPPKPVQADQPRPKNERQTRAEIRRRQALDQARLRQTEKQIAELEAEKVRLEGTFSVDTKPDIYQAYAQLIAELEDLYELFLELAE